MAKIRVMLVDDAVVVLKLVTAALADDPDIEVVGTAFNGARALESLDKLAPDIVVLDVEMPDMDGLSALKEIRKRRPKLPVVMFSTLTEKGAATTLNALGLGANDYVHKPANVGSISEARARVRNELIPKIKALCGPRGFARMSPAPFAHRPAAPVPAAKSMACPEVIVVGVSTGGPNALNTLLRTLPATFPVPVLVVQHMPPVFTRMLGERLSLAGNLPVREAVAGEMIAPGTVWLAPGDYHMAVRRDGAFRRLALNQGPPENSCRPAVDVLFRTAAEAYGKGVLAVVLTGMGSDGLAGTKAIVSAGGRVIVQDQTSSVVWGMPGAVADAGLAEAVVPLDQLGPDLVRRCRPRPALVGA